MIRHLFTMLMGRPVGGEGASVGDEETSAFSYPGDSE